MKENKTEGMKVKALLIITLVAVGIVSGSTLLYVTNANEAKEVLVLDFVNGKVILDAEDRELLKQEVINMTLEDDQVKELTAGKTFTTYVTLVKSLQEIEDLTLSTSTRIVSIEFDYVAVVTLVFEDGSGYTIPVNWDDWTVGDPEYNQQVSPPEPLIRIEPDGRRSIGAGR